MADKPVSTQVRNEQLAKARAAKAAKAGPKAYNAAPFVEVPANEPAKNIGSAAEDAELATLLSQKSAAKIVRETGGLPAAPPTREVAGLRPSRERHKLRPPEEYPMDSMMDTKFFIERPLRPGEHPRFPNGRKGDYPDGFDMQWVGIAVWGQALPQVVAEFQRKGWEPVYSGDFEGKYDGRFAPRGHQGPIILEDLMLMARPMAWSIKARAIAQDEARAQVNIKVNQLRQGELDKVTLGPQHKHLAQTNYINVSYEGVGSPGGPPLTEE